MTAREIGQFAFDAIVICGFITQYLVHKNIAETLDNQWTSIFKHDTFIADNIDSVNKLKEHVNELDNNIMHRLGAMLNASQPASGDKVLP